MTTFVLIAAAMLAAACAWVLVPLLTRRHVASIDRESSNLAVLRDQRAELEADLGNGVVSAEQYEITRAELDRRVLDETRRSEPDVAATPRRSGAWTAAGIGAAVPDRGGSALPRAGHAGGALPRCREAGRVGGRR